MDGSRGRARSSGSDRIGPPSSYHHHHHHQSPQQKSSGPLTTQHHQQQQQQVAGLKAKESKKSDKSLGKGRYKCRFCGEIKKQHVCPALIDIPRAQVGTQVDPALTLATGMVVVV